MTLDIAFLKNEAGRLKEKTNAANNNNDFLKNFVKFPEGNGVVQVRILGPAEAGMFGRSESPFYQATRTHKVNGKSLHCLKTLERSGKFVGDCPICKYCSWLWQESLKKAPEEAAKMQAQYRAIKPVERYYYNCIVKVGDASQVNTGPLILSIGKTLHEKIITGIVGNEELKEDGYGDITDRVTGRDFKIIKTIRVSGKDAFPNYDTSKFMDVSVSGSEAEVKTWMESLHDLAALRIVKEPEELKVALKKHLGLIPDDANGGFDPTEFQVPTDEEPSVHYEEASVTPAVNPVIAAAAMNSGESLGEDEFFTKLRQIQ